MKTLILAAAVLIGCAVGGCAASPIAASPTTAYPSANNGWYVMTYSGQAMAGPFLLLSQCTTAASALVGQFSNVSSICQWH